LCHRRVEEVTFAGGGLLVLFLAHRDVLLIGAKRNQ
jgi:hypothetical protein